MVRLASIAFFDIIGPLAVYFSLTYSGFSNVTALVMSGVWPAISISFGIARQRRLDPLGLLVLLGIVVGAIVGLATGNAHLVLLERTVPTLVFAMVCLGSLATSRPLMYRFALEAIGEDTPKGIEFADLWQYPTFRRAFRVLTVVWGLAFVAEAALHIIVIETASVRTAKATG